MANAGSMWARVIGVEREVPCGEPRVLPRVGHRQDVERVDVAPARVATVPPLGRGRFGVAGQPARHVVRVELLAPEHARERLAHDQRLVGGHPVPGQPRVERIGLDLPGAHHLAERRTERVTGDVIAGRSEAEPDLGARPGLQRDLVPRRRLRSRAVGHGCGTVDDVVVDPVLRVGRGRRLAVQAFQVGLVLAEQQRRLVAVRIGSDVERVIAEVGVRREQRAALIGRDDRRPWRAVAP